MASSNSPNDIADIDACLASMAPISSSQINNDMVPLHASQMELSDGSDANGSDSSPSPSRKPSLPRSRAKKVRKAAHQTQNSKPLLRPAKDILSRIRHDPALEESDFIVGYLDRHCPEVMEMEVSSWKGGGDVTDEEWIPQHRIMYFRRKSDEAGRKIWDRAARLDRLFGSGVVAHEQQGSNDRGGDEDAADSREEVQTTDRTTRDAGKDLVPASDSENDAGGSPIATHVEA